MKNADGLYLLAYVHTAIPQNAKALLLEILYELASNPSTLQACLDNENNIYIQAEKLCMQYYTRKLRKKLKPEQLRQIKTGFPLTDKLISLLRLPMSYKSALVLQLGLGLTISDCAAILKQSPAALEKKLALAKKQLAMSDAEIAETLKSVRKTDSYHRELLDKLALDASESGFLGKQRLRRFKIWLDSAVPFLAIAALLFVIFCVLAVQYGWI